MSNIKADNFLINLNWKKDIFEDFNGDDDYDLAGKRLVYLFLSMENIMRGTGEQVYSKDMNIDYPVKSLINQLKTMRGNYDVTDTDIALLRAEGKSSQEIATILSSQGAKISDSGVRKRNGWKNYEQYISAENFHKNWEF